MKRLLRRSAALLALGLGVLALPAVPPAIADSAAGPQPWTPLVLRRTGGELVHLADPSVVRSGDTWYLYGTSSSDGFEVWSSTDLATWTYGGLAWKPTAGSWNDHGNYWAPDVSVAPDGTWWMYYSASQRIGVASAPSPLGPFTDQLPHPLVGNGYGGVGDGVSDGGSGLLSDLDDKAIDANLYRAPDGTLTLYFAHMTPFSEIAALPLADPTTPAVAAPTTVLAWTGHLNSWEWWVREAPFVVEHDGVIHLMYSGNDFNSSCYALGDATATNPLGPFTRRADNPIVAQDRTIGFFGPGHNSVTEGPDGGMLVFLHVKDGPAYGGIRDTEFGPMTFDPAGNIVIDAPGDPHPVDQSCTHTTTPAVTTTTTTQATSAPAEGATAPPAAPIAARAAYAG